MILEFEVELVKTGLGKNKSAAELALSDQQRPRCLVPFSYYVNDPSLLEQRLGQKLGDLMGKPVTVMVTEMRPAMVGNGLSLSGELTLAVNNGKTAGK